MGNSSSSYTPVWKKKPETHYKSLIPSLTNEANSKLTLIIMYIKMKKWKHVITKQVIMYYFKKISVNSNATLQLF